MYYNNIHTSPLAYSPHAAHSPIAPHPTLPALPTHRAHTPHAPLAPHPSSHPQYPAQPFMTGMPFPFRPSHWEKNPSNHWQMCVWTFGSMKWYLCAWINMCVCVTRVYCLMLLARLLLRKSVRLTCLSNKYFFTSIMVVFFLPTICGHCCNVSSRKRWACISRCTVRNWIIITEINQTTCENMTWHVQVQA